MSNLTVIGGLRVRSNYDPPPVPDRSFDWSAWFEGAEEMGSGYGRNEWVAILDLLHMLEERGVAA